MADVGAGLEVCNETEFTQSLSFGYDGADGWTSEGWWNIDPGECSTPALDGVNRRYVYYRAEVDGGPFDGQSYFFCTSPQEYTIVGDAECAERGYDREDFREIDTGGNEGMFTFTLVADVNRPIGGDDTVTDPLAGPAQDPEEAPADDGDTGQTSGGFDFDRQGDDDAPATDDTMPEPGPEPEPEPEEEKPTRRGGSRGG